MKRIIYLVVSWLMVLSMVLIACAPKVTEKKEEAVTKEEVVTKQEVVAQEKAVVTEEKAGTVKWRGTKLDGTVVEKMIEKPRYGGEYVIAMDAPGLGFDEVPMRRWSAEDSRLAVEILFLANWARGPLGTEEWMTTAPYADGQPVRGILADDGLATGWKLPDPDTLVFHIRPGVHWALDPSSEASRLMNGREFTANDVVYNLRRNWSVGYLQLNYPHLRNMKNPAESVYVSPTDKWAVVLEAAPGEVVELFRAATGFQSYMPPEVIEKYGNMSNWRHVVGTGAFILKDYVSGSSLTWVKNPNYRGRDVFFPENQLPYVDTVKVLIIPDLSSRVSALRTGKIAYLDGLKWEDAESLKKNNPELKWLKSLAGASGLYLRNDVKPFDDIRVRRALNMAIDNEAIARDYYGGNAEVFNYPIKADQFPYIPLAQMPESVKELYGYYPEKAKQLLAEAGYPNGFQTNVVTVAADVDMLSIIAGYWEKIGVELKIDIKEAGVLGSMGRAKTYPQIYMYGLATSVINFMVRERPGKGRVSNYAQLTEQWVEDYYKALMDNFFDPVKTLDTWQEYIRRAAEQAWVVAPPNPYVHTFWQPWLKNFGGITSLGRFVRDSSAYHVWIDQDLKKKMGH